MRILHVASFNGNIGDNANHSGLRRKIASVIKGSIEYDEIEMRRFYKKYDGSDKLQFDLQFAELANQYDLVIIGGGNFFEIWLEDSCTGCTINMSQDAIDVLKTKVLFFGLGFDCYKGYSENTLKNFLNFIENLQDKQRFMVTVRNDGSIEQFIGKYGEQSSSMIRKVPDGGFFIDPSNYHYSLIPEGNCNIVLSLAIDMPSVRFGDSNEDYGYKLLVDSFVQYILKMVEYRKDFFFTFMPHIYSDLQVINEVIQQLPDYIRRNNIGVGPCLLGSSAVSLVFSAYRDADCVIAMRFHASVCSIGLGTPTIGISTYKKITDLYNELGISNRLIVARDESITIQLLEKTINVLDHSNEVIQENIKIKQKLERDFDSFLADFKNFVE